MKKRNQCKILFVLLSLCFIIFSCTKDGYVLDKGKELDENSVLRGGKEEDNKGVKKNPKIAIASDLHFFAPELLINKGESFTNYMLGDRKMLEESKAITQKLVADLLAEKPDMLFIPGDLTKDGELISHKGLVKELSKLREAGIKVYVVPGNHDINNPHAISFDGDKTNQVEQVNVEKFKEIYKDYGYDKAEMLEEGPDLCYLTEIAADLWLIGIDCCEYKENYELNTPVTGGSIDEQKLEWILKMTKKAKDAGKHVMGMMHHGIVEHFPGQAQLAPEYLVKDWERISTMFADAGLSIVFTGHFHAHDIVKKTVGDKYIIDIQTGSTVTFPAPYRIIQVTDDVLDIKTKRLEGVVHENIKADSFQKHAQDCLEDDFPLMIKSLVDGYGERFPILKDVEPYIDFIIPCLKEAFVNHLRGDEKGLVETAALYSMIKDNVPEEYKMHIPSVEAVLIDTDPMDNNLIIYMESGKTE